MAMIRSSAPTLRASQVSSIVSPLSASRRNDAVDDDLVEVLYPGGGCPVLGIMVWLWFLFFG
jgi:hypothetical protein